MGFKETVLNESLIAGSTVALGWLAGAGDLRCSLAWGATYTVTSLVLDQLTKNLLSRVEFTRKLVNVGVAANIAREVTNKIFKANMNNMRSALVAAAPLLINGIKSIRQLS